ncbi:hypothetical protein GY45DRAFT_363226 [Cubamyces sp. BRFM 1775]|nr:hypothetical protein GY45DRAFT_363226 [Cubamyces sp. BRFM 1775]
MDASGCSGTIQYDASALTNMRRLLASSIISFFIECFLFGAFTITYATGAWALLCIGRRGKPRKREWGIFVASTTMFCLALTNLALSIKSMLLSFLEHAGSLDSVYDTLGVPWVDNYRLELEDDSLISAIFIAKFAIYVTQTLIGDAFMIYRLYVIWDGRKLLLIAPVLLFLASLATGYGSVHFFAVYPTIFSVFSFFNSVLFTGKSSSFNMAASKPSEPLPTNRFLVLVMWRILSPRSWATAPSSIHSKRSYMVRKASEAIVQSAAIYSIASVAVVITYLFSSNVGWPVCLNVFPPLIGLVFSFIMKRIARNAVVNPVDAIPPPACMKTNTRRNVSTSSIALTTQPPRSPELVSTSVFDNSNETLLDIMTTNRGSTAGSLILIGEPGGMPRRYPDGLQNDDEQEVSKYVCRCGYSHQVAYSISLYHGGFTTHSPISEKCV